MLSSTIPLFPLPSVVLFPSVFLPLHVFEARYRQMVADALDGERLIGMVLLKPGWEGAYDGRPPVYEVGCAGLITFSEQQPDGRFNIVLRGVEKFRILEEDHSRPYRVARVQPVLEPVPPADGALVRAERQRLETLLVAQAAGRGADVQLPPSMSDEELINALAQYMDLEPLEKQALLERDGLLARGRSLGDLLEMRMLMAQTTQPWTGDSH